MKFNKSLRVCAMVLAFPLSTTLWAEDDVAPPTPAPARTPTAATAPAPVPVAKSRSGRNRVVDEISTDINAQTRGLAAQISAEARSANEHARAAALELRRGLRPRDGNRTLVLPKEAGRPESLGETHEDLSVMSRILNKVADKESRRGNTRNFVFSGFGETGSNLDAMYLEGYGAMFLLNADFPLTAPPQPPAAKPAAKEEDSTWERAKQEVRGHEDFDDDGFGFGKAGGNWNWEEDQPKFDAERVEALKKRLTDALKHAKNLRALRDGEHVSVIVFGKTIGKRTHLGRMLKLPDQVPNDDEVPVTKAYAANVVGYVNTDAVRQSTLVIRAKKSDIMRFASGEIKSDEFAKTVSVSAF